MVIFSDNSDTNEWSHTLFIQGGTLGFDFTVDEGNRVRLVSSEVVTDGQWHSAVVVRGEDYVEIWLDNELIAQTSYTGDVDFSNTPLFIGQNPLGGELFSGNIDDFKISNVPRHQEDFMTGLGIVEFP